MLTGPKRSELRTLCGSTPAARLKADTAAALGFGIQGAVCRLAPAQYGELYNVILSFRGAERAVGALEEIAQLYYNIIIII